MSANATLTFTNQHEHLAWIIDFANRKYNTDVSDVRALLIPGYQAGGGGLYMKASELGFGVKLQGAKDALGKRSGEADDVEKGKVVFVRELQPKADPTEGLTVCWILWHEFGHAVGDRQIPKNTSEPYAYRFEFAAILEGYNTGQLAKWGFTSEMIKKFLDDRKKGKPESAELSALVSAIG
jgi:hypothetical protein